MIRIDEIYNHTFWPWLEHNVPGLRMFFCDPPGNTNPDSIFNFGSDDIVETDYVFFHDQEPVHVDQYEPLFEEICRLSADIIYQQQDNKLEIANWQTGAVQCRFPQVAAGSGYKKPFGHVVVSERGEYVEALCEQYGWRSHYYFYHGWACQDWFRGYDKAFLIPRASDRTPTRTFMSPNRIVAGKRDHRVLFLYNVFKNGLEHNHISAPRVCQYEGVDIASIAQKYTNVYQDITDVFTQADLPRLFQGEEQQKMTSCWLSNFTEAQDSLVYVPTETVYFGRRQHITEKTFKAIALEMPFVLVAPAGSLEYLREYGFQTFNNIFDESYDIEINDVARIEKVTKLLKDLDSLTVKERYEIHRACLPIVKHNYEHFYGQGFSQILWTELTGMLRGFQV